MWCANPRIPVYIVIHRLVIALCLIVVHSWYLMSAFMITEQSCSDKVSSDFETTLSMDAPEQFDGAEDFRKEYEESYPENDDYVCPNALHSAFYENGYSDINEMQELINDEGFRNGGSDIALEVSTDDFSHPTFNDSVKSPRRKPPRTPVLPNKQQNFLQFEHPVAPPPTPELHDASFSAINNQANGASESQIESKSPRRQPPSTPREKKCVELNSSKVDLLASLLLLCSADNDEYLSKDVMKKASQTYKTIGINDGELELLLISWRANEIMTHGVDSVSTAKISQIIGLLKKYSINH